MSIFRKPRVLLYGQDGKPVCYEDGTKDGYTKSTEEHEDVTELARLCSQLHVAVKKQNESKKKWYQATDGKQFAINVLTFVVTIAATLIAFVYGFIYYGQMKASRDQADTAGKQFAVMTNQLTEMHEENILGERAWVGAFNGAIQPLESPTNSVCLKVLFKNTGKSPALKMDVFIGEAGILADIPKKDNRPSKTDYSGTLYPDAVGTITTHTPMEGPTIKAIQSGMPHYVYGTIWYDDIFGGHHWSQFSYWLTYTPKADFLPIAAHNSCDDAERNTNK